MASANALDLNKLLPARRTIAFGDREYEVPGDMPFEIYLRTQIAFADDTPEEESTNQLKQAFLDLLLFYLPGDEDAKTQAVVDMRQLGVRTIILLLNAIYKDAEDEDEGSKEAGNSSSQENTTAEAIPTTTGDSSNDSSPTPNLTIPEPQTVPVG